MGLRGLPLRGERQSRAGITEGKVLTAPSRLAPEATERLTATAGSIPDTGLAALALSS